MPIINTVIAGGGTTPTGTLPITNNGIYDVSAYANADVQVPTTAPALYQKMKYGSGNITKDGGTIPDFSTTPNCQLQDYLMANMFNGINFEQPTQVDFSGIFGFGNRSFYYAFYGCTKLVGSVVITATSFADYALYSAFSGTGITSVTLSAVAINTSNTFGQCFADCVYLTSADLSSLTTISGSNACQYMFQNCTGLTSINLSSLTTISGSSACSNMFQNCTGLTTANLSSLTTLNGFGACASMFAYCTSLATVYLGGTTAIDFGTRTNQFSNIFNGCTQNIDVYAPAANQTQIEAFSGYPNFAGTGTVTWHWRS